MFSCMSKCQNQVHLLFDTTCCTPHKIIQNINIQERRRAEYWGGPVSAESPRPAVAPHPPGPHQTRWLLSDHADSRGRGPRPPESLWSGRVWPRESGLAENNTKQQDQTEDGAARLPAAEWAQWPGPVSWPQRHHGGGATGQGLWPGESPSEIPVPVQLAHLSLE